MSGIVPARSARRHERWERVMDDGTMRWLAVQERAHQMLSENPDWRHGQALFNALHEIDPTLANEIRGTDADPFHVNSMEQIGAFGVAVMSRIRPGEDAP